MSNKGMSFKMYEFIKTNQNKLKYDLENGLVITPKGGNGSLCNSTGYLKVRMGKKVLQVHQVLAVIYFGEQCIGKQINHEDGNKLNNKKTNLTPCTQSENIKHQYENELYGDRSTSKKIKVDKLDMDGNYICTYDSILEACEDVGLKAVSSIIRAIKGYGHAGVKYNSAGGYKWRHTP